MKIINSNLYQFVHKHKLPSKLYDIFIQENIEYNQLNYLTLNDIDNICNYNKIPITKKLQLKEAIKKYANNKMTVLIVGDKGVGKTSLIRKYTNKSIQNDGYAVHTEQLNDGSVMDIIIWDVNSMNFINTLFDIIFYNNFI